MIRTVRKKISSEVRIISWNLDGLDETDDLLQRTAAAADAIAASGCTVVCLQELVPRSLELLRTKLRAQFEFFLPDELQEHSVFTKVLAPGPGARSL